MPIHMGKDYEGVSSFKVTRGSFDPGSTPDEQRHKFYFSSKWGNIATPVGLDKADFLNGSKQVTYIPTGSADGNFRRRRERSPTSFTNTLTTYMYRKAFFDALRYDMPLVDITWKRISNGRFTQRRVWHNPRGIETSAGTQGGYFATGAALEFGWGRGLVADSVDVLGINLGYGTYLEANNFNPSQVLSPDVGMHKRLIVWNLPGDNTAMDGPASVSKAEGKLAFQITSDQCRCAKPGFDVRTAAAKNIAFDANNRAVRIIAAGDVAVPAGVSSSSLGIDVPDEVVPDVHFYSGSSIVFPANAEDRETGADYWFSGDRIFFSNPNAACRARFIVLAYDDAPPTTGVNRVYRKFRANGENHVQILRPGAASPPNFADIVLDTRWPVPQILAEDYFVVGSGPRSHVVDYDGTGMFVFVKYATVHGAGRHRTASGELRFLGRVRPPFTKIVRWTDGAHGGDSTYVTYNQKRATFRTFKGAITSKYLNNKGEMVTETDDNPIVGLRYFVLGIPAA